MLNFILSKSYAQGKLYSVCSDSHFKMLKTNDCNVERVNKRKEDSLMSALKSPNCVKPKIPIIVGVSGVKCSLRIHFTSFSNVSRIIETPSVLNSRMFGEIDPSRVD